MADFEENVEEMVRTTREVAATESGGDETAVRPGTRSAVPGTRPAMARDERDSGDRWANLYGQRGVRIL